MTDFTVNQKEFLEKLFTKLDNKIDQKAKEITDKIDKFEEEIKRKIIKIEERIDHIEVENRTIIQQILNIERRVRKNNIVVFGIDENENDLKKVICNIFQDILEVPTNEAEINDIYRLRNNSINRSPVIVEFISYQKKLQVLKEAKKLKGSNIYIAKDVCTEDRNRDKILIKHLKEARGRGIVAYIKGNKLYVANEPFTAEQLENGTDELEKVIRKQTEAKEKPQSAPATPTTSKKTKRQTEESVDDQNEQKKQKSSEFVQSTRVQTRSNSTSKK